MKAVVLTFDRMPTHLLGCYGNEWMETPGLDRLAALGCVFDQHFVEVPGPVGPNHSWWTGQYEYFVEPPNATTDSKDLTPNWLRRLGENGVKCRLVAENTEGLPTELFYSSEAVGGVTGLNAQHDDVPIARLVQRGIEILKNGGVDSQPSESASESKPELLWLHSAGVPSPWLPPRLFAELYLDELEEIVDGESGQEIASDLVSQFENDPDLVKLLLSDWRREANGDDENAAQAESQPDESDDIESPELERQISRMVFAGYVSMIDRWLLKLLEAVENSGERILLVVSSNQGHSFGETADLKLDASVDTASFEDSESGAGIGLFERLSDSEVRTPLLIAEFSGTTTGQEFGSRHRAIIQPADLAATLEEWLARETTDSPEGAASAGMSLLKSLAGDRPSGRPLAFSIGQNGNFGVRSRNWSLTTSSEALSEVDILEASIQLFAKPDDQWDVHNVSSQYRSEVNLLLNELRKRLNRGDPASDAGQ